MKIFFLINSPFPNYVGGIETWLYNVTERLCKEHEIIIIAKDDDDLPNYFPNIDNRIKIVKYSSLVSYRQARPFVKSYLRLLDYCITARNMGEKLEKVIKNGENCYVIALDSLFCIKAGLKANNKTSDFKLISSIRCPHGELWGDNFPLFKNMIIGKESKYLKKVDAIWSNGYDTIEIYKKRGFSSSLMRNGVDYKKLTKIAESTSRKDNRFRIVSIGTLLPIKGIYELIDAATKLIRNYNYDLDLYFIGKGDKKKYYEYAKVKKIERNVQFLGHQQNPTKFLSGNAISACLSGGSGMGMAAIEAMSSRKPVIAWDSAVYRQFNRSQQTMFLVEEKNVTALTDGIKELIDNYEFYSQELVENARTEAKNYDWEIVCNDLVTNLLKI